MSCDRPAGSKSDAGDPVTDESLTVNQGLWPLPEDEALMEDWLIMPIAEYPKRLGGWTVLWCCPPRIWRAMVV